MLLQPDIDMTYDVKVGDCVVWRTILEVGIDVHRVVIAKNSADIVLLHGVVERGVGVDWHKRSPRDVAVV